MYTFVFTDIENSTPLWERMGPALLPVIETHNRVLREASEHWHGSEIKFVGDGMMLVFGPPSDALRWSVEVQRELGECDWPEEVGHLRVRVGMHAGETARVEGADGLPDYFGPHVNRAARIASEARGGEVLLSSVVRDVVYGMLAEEFQFQDLGMHTLRGLAEALHLYRLVHPQIPTLEPRAEPFRPARHNLPAYLTPLVDREAEMEQICSLLRSDDCRLVTLVGPPGVGKTRLAVAAASQLLDDFPDQVRFIDLAPLTRADDVVSAIAGVTGLVIQPPPAPPPREQLLAFLEGRGLLLVVDNLEHLPESWPIITEILRRAAAVRCLATSRRVLGIPGEHVAQVEPLEVPREGAQFSQAVQASSVQLFAQLARAQQGRFQVTRENIAQVSQVCRSLQGLPLAMELAASRVRSLSLRELATRLAHGFAVLAEGGRDTTERHRTLHNAVAWSYGLLRPDEQLALGYFSQFNGGFTLEAAEAVCQLPDTFDCLADLCDQSLVAARPEGDHTRYNMLEYVRQFAAERMPEDERHLFQRRHIDHYVRLALAAAAHADMAKEPEAFLSLEEDLPNLRQAMRWAVEMQDAERVCKLATATTKFMRRRGLWRERLEWLTDAVALLRWDVEITPDLRSLTLHELANALHDVGDLDGAQPVVEESLALSEAAGEAAGQARAHNLLGLIFRARGQEKLAGHHLDQGLTIAASSGDRRCAARCITNKALLPYARREWEAARALLEEALSLAHAVGDEVLAGLILGNLGCIAEEVGDYPLAQKMFQDSLRVHLKMRDVLAVAIAANNLGEVAEHLGDAAKAVRLVSASRQALGSLGSPVQAKCDEILERLRNSLGAEEYESQAALGAERPIWEVASELLD